jgi:hypothetical protein
MEPNITRMAGQSEMPPGREKENTMIHKHPVGAFTLRQESTTIGLKIDRDQILAKYWELANLDPERTKGSIAGQLSALEALWEELRRKPAETNRPSSHEVYRSAWMTGSSRAN